MNEKLRRILPTVQKPARYTGGELGAIIKNKDKVRLRMAFCFPDTYEIGMSNIGMRILCGVANSIQDVWCERVFAPWGDMESAMRENGIPLFTLESGDEIRDFDVIAFSLGYEMAYTNMLNMLDLAGLPVRSADRTDDMPLVIAGGCCCYNSEPIAPFVDLVSLGEGEELTRELLELYMKVRGGGGTKQDYLREAVKIQGVYVPAFYDVEYNGDGTVRSITPTNGAPETVTKRIVKDLDTVYYTTPELVPNTEIVHDRVNLELFRGCIRGYRFCQAGFAYRPVRSKSCDKLIADGERMLKESGYEEITLSSLSTSDYKDLGRLCDGLLEFCEPRKTNLALPSLRADNFSMELMQKIQKVRRSGMTFAPEAGTQRLRDVINKNVTEEDVLSACRTAFAAGWNGVKLYFMMGLPTETDEDVLGIARLAEKVLHEWRLHAVNKTRGVRITVSTSCFVPKAHTPFQWEKQDTMEEFRRKQQLLKEEIRARNVSYSYHDADTSFIEAVLSRGDRRVAEAIEQAWRNGAHLDAWDEYFSLENWTDAFEQTGIDPAFYANRERGEDEVLPWRVTTTGVGEKFLLRERHRAYEGVVTPDCRHGCAGCGANLLNGGKCDE